MLDSWILAQFGIGDNCSTPPVLVGLPLTYAIETMERVAALDIGGYSKHRIPFTEMGVTRAAARAHGFKLAQENRIGASLDRAYEGFCASNSSQPATLKSAYGWFFAWFNGRGGERFSPALAGILIESSQNKFQIVSDAFPSIPRTPTSVTLSDAAKQCRVSIDTLRRILVQKEKLRPNKIKGSPIRVQLSDLASVRASLDACVATPGVAELLGTGPSIVRNLIAAGAIKSWIPGGKKGAIFHRNDIANWLSGLSRDAEFVTACPPKWIDAARAPNVLHVPIVELVRAIEGGEVQVRGRLRNRVGLSSILVSREETRRFRTPQVRKKPYGRRGPYKKNSAT